MNKRLLWLLMLPLLVACKNDDDGGSAGWSSRLLVSGGSAPVASNDGRRILFTQEVTEPGLDVLTFPDAVRRILVAGNFNFRADYAWSYDGGRLCVSSPTEGIFVYDIADPEQYARVWTLGSNPRFLPGDSLIVCAGPEDGSSNQGIRIMSVSGEFRQQISPFGTAPEPSPDGHKIAFLALSGSSTGRTLIVYNRVTQVVDTLGQRVLNFSWLGDSETIAYEGQDTLRSAIYLTSLGNSTPVRLFDGARPDGGRDGVEFVFAAVAADQNAGIRLRTATGSVETITEFGSQPCLLDRSAVAFQSAGGLHLATFVDSR